MVVVFPFPVRTPGSHEPPIAGGLAQPINMARVAITQQPIRVVIFAGTCNQGAA